MTQLHDAPLVHCRWLEHIFQAADKNGDDTLDLKEIIKLAKELNMGFTKRNIENMFEVRILCTVCITHTVVMS